MSDFYGGNLHDFLGDSEPDSDDTDDWLLRGLIPRGQPGMNDIDQIVSRIKALREPHREHAIKRIEHMLEGFEDHEAEFAARVTVPMRCPPGV